MFQSAVTRAFETFVDDVVAAIPRILTGLVFPRHRRDNHQGPDDRLAVLPAASLPR